MGLYPAKEGNPKWPGLDWIERLEIPNTNGLDLCPDGPLWGRPMGEGVVLAYKAACRSYLLTGLRLHDP